MPAVSLRPDFAQVQQRYAAWWSNSSLGDRPIVCAREIRRPGAPPPPADDRPRRQRELDCDWQLAAARWTLDAHARPADTLPLAVPDFANSLGIPGVFVGGQLDYRAESTWVEEMPDVYDRRLPDFSPDHPVFRSLNTALERMARELGGQAIVNPPYMLDGLTTLSLFRGAEALCMDLYDRPDDVSRVVEHLDRVALAAHAAFYATAARYGQTHTVTWADVYAPGSCEMLQADFCVNLSPEMFDRFAAPSLQRWADHFQWCCYHLDGEEQYRFIDRFCAIDKIRSIQWQPGDINRQPMKYLDYLQDMRRRGRAVWVMAFDADTPVALTEAMGPDGLMFYLRDVTSLADVEGMMQRLLEVCRKRPS